MSSDTAKVLLGLSIVLLASCRLVITTDETGHIISASGSLDCDKSVCAFPITEETTDTFTAVPATGFRFVKWNSICTSSPTAICQATVVPLSDELQHFDGDIGLSAVFEPISKHRAWFRDEDGDHYGSADQRVEGRQQPDGFVMNKGDCDDTDGSVHPYTKELNDDRDNNCNGKIDEGFVDVRFFVDGDNDGFGNPDPALSVMGLDAPEGYVRNKFDCNDSNALDNPEAEEVLDGRDNDCDGNIDEGSGDYYRDVDGDGFGAQGRAIESLEPIEGYVQNDHDCDDNNASIFPGAQEEFDSADNNCDGQVDEGFTVRNYYLDADSDGYGDAASSVSDNVKPEGYVTNSSDNCVNNYNPGQQDIDRDGIGDACDSFTDSDSDGVQDSADNCPARSNRSQADADDDGLGDACDSQNGLDLDDDGVNAEQDNCPTRYNPSQSDRDGDGKGDACDAVDDSDNGEDNSPGSCSVSAEDQAMLNAVNSFRSQPRVCGTRGNFPAVAPLTWSCELKMAALSHSMDMANNNFFSHTGYSGQTLSSRANAAGYAWSALGENIAAGTSSVNSVMQLWIDSPGHCANIMGSSFTNFGAAKFSNSSSRYHVYWTQAFGRPR